MIIRLSRDYKVIHAIIYKSIPSVYDEILATSLARIDTDAVELEFRCSSTPKIRYEILATPLARMDMGAAELEFRCSGILQIIYV